MFELPTVATRAVAVNTQILGSVIAAHPLGEFIVKFFYPLVDAPPLLTRPRNQYG